MDRTNIFNPFANKHLHEEDVATRALGTVLRYSPIAVSVLRAALRAELLQLLDDPEKSKQGGIGKGVADTLTVLTALDDVAVEPKVYTQRRDLPACDLVLSASITATEANGGNATYIGSEAREGEARYDLVVEMPGTSLVVVLEAKPTKSLPSIAQLRPTRQDLTESSILPWAVHLNWRQLTTAMLACCYASRTSPAERAVINDLTFFLGEHQPTLSPVHPLAKLHEDQTDLILVRLEQALEKLLHPETGSGPQHYRGRTELYIETGLAAVKHLNVGVWQETGRDAVIELALPFGDTQTQARAFFRNAPHAHELQRLSEEPGWHVRPNFHLHFMATHLIWYPTDTASLDTYLDYWSARDGPGWTYLSQQDKPALKQLLREMEEQNVIMRDSERRDIEQRELWDSNRQKFNIAPGLLVVYRVPFGQAQEQDTQTSVEPLARFMSEKVRLALNTVGICNEQIQSSSLNLGT